MVVVTSARCRECYGVAHIAESVTSPRAARPYQDSVSRLAAPPTWSKLLPFVLGERGALECRRLVTTSVSGGGLSRAWSVPAGGGSVKCLSATGRPVRQSSRFVASGSPLPPPGSSRHGRRRSAISAGILYITHCPHRRRGRGRGRVTGRWPALSSPTPMVCERGGRQGRRR